MVAELRKVPDVHQIKPGDADQQGRSPRLPGESPLDRFEKGDTLGGVFHPPNGRQKDRGHKPDPAYPEHDPKHMQGARDNDIVQQLRAPSRRFILTHES